MKLNRLYSSISLYLVATFLVMLGVFVYNYHRAEHLDRINGEFNGLILKWNRLHRHTQALLIVETDLISHRDRWRGALTDFERSLQRLLASKEFENYPEKIGENLRKIETWWQLPGKLLKEIRADLDAYMTHSRTPNEGKLSHKLGKLDAHENPREYFLLNQVELRTYQFFLVETGFIKSLSQSAEIIGREIKSRKVWNLIQSVVVAVLLFASAMFFNIRSRARVEMLNATLELRVDERTRDLRAANRELQAIFGAFPDLYFWLNKDGTIAGYQSSRHSFLYARPEQYIGKRAKDLLPSGAAGIIDGAVAGILAGRSSVNVEYALPAKGEERFFEGRFQPLGETQILAIIREITDRKRTMRQLEAAREEAVRANRAKTEFIANMSHEIRTPMNSVLGFTDLLDAYITERKPRSYLEAVKSSGEGLLTIINDLLDLSKIEAGKLKLKIEATEIHRVVESVRRIFSLELSRKKLGFLVDISPDLPSSLLLDEVRLRQVLVNLVGNAVKFTDRGRIRVSVKGTCDPLGKNTLDLTIMVEDTGIGIPEEDHHRVFEAFQQVGNNTSQESGGTGLGLAICKRLVQMMGGEIFVQNNAGRGAIFTVVLPGTGISEERPRDGGEVPGGLPDCRFAEATILAVDDIESNLNLIVECFHHTPIRVLAAGSGEEAVGIARTHCPDLILMDIRMPVMDGFQTTQLLRNDPGTVDIPVVAVTATQVDEWFEVPGSSGFNGFLRKPISRETLFNEVRRFVGHAGIGMEPPSVHPDFAESPPSGDGRGSKLPVSFGTYEQEMNCFWEALQKRQPIKKVRAFSDRVHEYGRHNKIPELTAFGVDLGAYLDAYDVRSIRSALARFPELMEKVKRSRGFDNPRCRGRKEPALPV